MAARAHARSLRAQRQPLGPVLAWSSSPISTGTCHHLDPVGPHRVTQRQMVWRGDGKRRGEAVQLGAGAEGAVHVRTSRVGLVPEDGWHVRRRQPQRADSASVHHREPPQHEYRQPCVGRASGSDQLGGRCSAAAM